MNRADELVAEFKIVFHNRNGVLDAVLPPFVFLIFNAVFGTTMAMWGSLGLAVLLMIIRLRKGQSVLYAIGGVVGISLAILIASRLDRAEGFFLPNILSGALMVVGSAISVVIGRSLVAWTSYLTRRWPLEWYWHPRVRPAYNEVTLLWTIFFALRLLVQINVFQGGDEQGLAILQLVLGWPATILLLIVSYLYGMWRLQKSGGPSVQEFRDGVKPPWEGQKQGF